MPFRCPQCLTVDTLGITHSIDLPPDRRRDEISLQVVACSACKFRALAVYEESRGSELAREEWAHIGYRVSPDAVESVILAITSCSQPHNPHCRCAAHTSLGEKNPYGLWRGLLEMERGRTFAMRMYM
jgi:hypothetical protein